MTTPTADAGSVEEQLGEVTEAQRPHITIKLPGFRRKTGAKATARIGTPDGSTKITLRSQIRARAHARAEKFRGWLNRRSTFTKFLVFFAAVGVASFASFFMSYFIAYGAIIPALAWAGNIAFGWQVLTVAGEMTGFGTVLFGLGEFIGVVGGIAAFISMLGPIDRFFGLEIY